MRRQALRSRHQEPCPQWPASCSAQYSAACWSVTGNQSHPVSQQQATNHIQCHNNHIQCHNTAGNQSHTVSQLATNHIQCHNNRQPITSSVTTITSSVTTLQVPYSVTTGNQSHPVSQQQATNHIQCHNNHIQCHNTAGNQSHTVSQQQATNHIQCHNNRQPITSSVTTTGNQSQPMSQSLGFVSSQSRATTTITTSFDSFILESYWEMGVCLGQGRGCLWMPAILNLIVCRVKVAQNVQQLVF